MTREELKQSLEKYIPEKAIESCIDFITRYRISLRITHARLSKLGDYRAPHSGNGSHRITINHNLNQYSFLVTFIHEVAHLTAWNKYKHTVDPHGAEWKTEFKFLLHPFLEQSIFPDDVHVALKNYLMNPAASSCTDDKLYRTLKKYDAPNGFQFLEELPHGSEFKMKGYANIFIKGKLLRKTFQCKMKDSNREFRVSAVAEVQQVTLF